MRKKRILVTGSSRGIGKATALALLAEGHHVILHASNPESLSGALREATERSGDRATGEVADLGDLEHVESLCRRLEADDRGLDVLVNNAGLVTHDLRYSTQTIELQFAVNHLAGFYLANRLLPLLAARSPDRTPAGNATGGGESEAPAPGRIVQVSSIAHGFIKEVDFSPSEVVPGARMGTEPFDHRYHYYRSKLANVLFVAEWARRIPRTGVTANALHPGIVQTRLSRAYMKNPLFRFFESLIASSPTKAAGTSVYLSTDESVSETSGAFFKASRRSPIKGLGADRELGYRLWETSLASIPAELRRQLTQSFERYEHLLGVSNSHGEREHHKGTGDA